MINVEAFSCSGGMAEGFRRAGVRFHMVVDKDPDACASYERNLGHAPRRMDFRALVRFYRAGRTLGPINLFVADPPCTPWSRAGKRLGVQDKRDMLLATTEFIRLARPRAYLIGNVPGLDDSTQWRHLQAALAPLRRVGYCIADYTSLDAADFGVPQHRVRPFWFGHLGGPCIRWPLPTHGDPQAQAFALPGLGLTPWVTCRQALQHLPLELLGRPVRLKRDPPHDYTGKTEDLAFRGLRRHPVSELDSPGRTLHGEGGRAGRPEAVLALQEPGNGGAVLELVERTPDPNHPADSLDEPSRAVTTQAGCTNLLEWLWDRPATSILRDPRIPPPGHHSTGSFLSPPEARGTKKRGPAQSAKIGKPDEPSATLLASSGRIQRGAEVVKAWPWDRPSTTVLAHSTLNPPGHHEVNTRSMPNAVVLSERAATILQGFPEDWYFAGKTKKARWSQLGQAMPPPLAEAVARSVVAQLAATEERAEGPPP